MRPITLLAAILASPFVAAAAASGPFDKPAPPLSLLDPHPGKLAPRSAWTVPRDLLRRTDSKRAVPESEHRDGESGGVILEMTKDGIRELHCHGHRFPKASREHDETHSHPAPRPR